VAFRIDSTAVSFIRSKLFAVEVSVKLRSRPKMSKIGTFSFGTLMLGGAYIPNFRHSCSNLAHFRTCGKVPFCKLKG